MRAAALVAAIFLVLLRVVAAHAAVLHQAVTVRGAIVAFYAGHLVLDANGGASIDDGVYRVTAQRVILDLRENRYVAAGNVVVCTTICRQGAVFGDDLSAHRALFVALQPALERDQLCDGATCGSTSSTGVPSQAPASDPLGLPDTEGEEPYAVAQTAVAHLGADVRLMQTRVIIPSGRSFYFPAYVYTFSSDPGYVLSNVPGSGEDVPIYVGSTRNSIQGLHFMYNPITKIALGVDEHIVNGQKSYALISESPLFGPDKVANFTWQEAINGHTVQTFTSAAIEGIGLTNAYDLRDSVHRSFIELTGNQFHRIYAGTLAWQGFDQAVAPSGLGSLFYFHLRSEYGGAHNPDLTPFFPFPTNAIMPSTVVHGALEGYVAVRPLTLSANDTLSFSFDDRQLRDSLPHTQTLQIYAASLSHRWNQHLTTSFGESITPVHDGYPTVNTGIYTRIDSQTASLFYQNGNAFGLSLNAIHGVGFTDNIQPLIIQPWFLSTDVRFRLGRTLALDLSRSYNFNFEGRTWGGFGIQILP